MEFLNNTKAFLRVDGEEDDSVIHSLIEAAIIFIKQGTGVSVKSGDAQSLLCMNMLVAYWYENRNAVGQGVELPFTITSQLIQLETRGEQSESTGS